MNDFSGQVSVGVPLGAPSRVRCYVYPEQAPILTVVTRSASLSLSAPELQVSDGDVQAARDLLREVGVYVDAIERQKARQALAAAGLLAEVLAEPVRS